MATTNDAFIVPQMDPQDNKDNESCLNLRVERYNGQHSAAETNFAKIAPLLSQQIHGNSSSSDSSVVMFSSHQVCINSHIS